MSPIKKKGTVKRPVKPDVAMVNGDGKLNKVLTAPSLVTAIANVRKKHGAHSIMSAKKLMEINKIHGRIPSGIYALDFITGGGLPKGKVTLFRGMPSSGKSLTAYLVIIFTLVRDPSACAAIVDHEGSYDDDFMYTLIRANFPRLTDNKVQDVLDRIMVSLPDTLEEGIEITESLISSGVVDVLLFDSIANASPSDELEGSMDDWQRGLSARIWNKAWRRVQTYLSSTRKEDQKSTAAIFINQPRNTMVQYGPQITYPGGRGQNHAAHLILDFSNPDWQKEGEAEKTFTYGQRVVMFTYKNKTYAARKYGNYMFYFEPYGNAPIGFVDNAQSTFDLALMHGTIEQASSSYTVHYLKQNAVKRGGILSISLKPAVEKFRGKAQVVQAMRDNPKLMLSVQDMLNTEIRDRRSIQ